MLGQYDVLYENKSRMHPAARELTHIISTNKDATFVSMGATLKHQT